MLRNVITASLLVALAAWMVTARAETQTPYREGEHYERLPYPVETRDPDKIEVIEVFSYACIHCKNFEPALKAWLPTIPDDVDFYRMPATFNSQWETLGQLFYTAEALGVTDKVHDEIYRAIHDRGVNLTDPTLMAEFFQEKAGVDPDEFNKVFSSFSVRSRVQQAHARGVAYRISGTPTMIVDGRYRVDGRMAGGNARMLDVVNYLVAQRREAKSGDGATSAASEGEPEGGR